MNQSASVVPPERPQAPATLDSTAHASDSDQDLVRTVERSSSNSLSSVDEDIRNSEPAHPIVVRERLYGLKNSWRVLVHDGKLLSCPWCEANASFSNHNFFNGLKSFLSHARNRHRDVGGVTEQKILDNAVPLTKEQEDAFNNANDFSVQSESHQGRDPALLT